PGAGRLEGRLCRRQPRRHPWAADRPDDGQRHGAARADLARLVRLRAAGRVSDGLPGVLRQRAPHDVRSRDRRRRTLMAQVGTLAAGGEYPPGGDLVVRRIAGSHLAVALVALFVGGLFGALQAFNYAGVKLYQPINEALPAPLTLNYYQGLTAHGVLMVLVHTTFFIMAFLIWVTARALRQPLVTPRLAWAAFVV